MLFALLLQTSSLEDGQSLQIASPHTYYKYEYSSPTRSLQEAHRGGDRGIDFLQHDFVASYTHWISVSQGASSEGTATPTPNLVL